MEDDAIDEDGETLYDDDVEDTEIEKTKKAISTDYGKVAKAVNDIINAGIKVSLVNINDSDFGFKPDVKNNRILFGMKALLNVNDELVNTIIENRPYYSIKDFYQRVRPQKQAMISLIKAGAFDDMMDRKLAMGWFIWETCDKKSKLTLQNMPTLIKRNMLPTDTEDRRTAYRIFEFNRYLKAICKRKDDSVYYYLDNRALAFLDDIGCYNLVKELRSAIEKEAAEHDNKFITNEKQEIKEKESYDYETLMKEFQELVEGLMNKDSGNAGKITSVIEHYLGKGKKASEITPYQAEFLALINEDLRNL